MSPIITAIPPPRISAAGWPLSKHASIRTPALTDSGSKITSTPTKKNYASQGRRGLGDGYPVVRPVRRRRSSLWCLVFGVLQMVPTSTVGARPAHDASGLRDQGTGHPRRIQNGESGK